jgi:hypothetical protein
LRRAGLRVLYTSGEGVTDAMKAMFVAGATLLPKPYTPADLTRAIGKLAAPKNRRRCHAQGRAAFALPS